MANIHSKAWLRANAWRYSPDVFNSIHYDKRNTLETIDGIEYEYNNYGFRNPHMQEFYYTHRPIALGCSITLGFGVAHKDTWHELIEPHCNLGQNSGTLETCYRLLLHWLPKIKPSVVRLLTPPMGRREVFEDDWTAIQYVPGGQTFQTPTMFTSETEIQLNQQRMLNAIMWLCRDTVLIVRTWEQVAELCIDKGADNLHPGIKSHQAISKVFNET